MNSILEVKEALVARSTSADLDELRSQGRSRVRVIRAEHVAAMISEAVEQAVRGSGMVPPEEVERLEAESRERFQDIVKQRQAEAAELEQLRAQLQELSGENEQLRERLARHGQLPVGSGESEGPGEGEPAPSAGGAPGVSQEMLMMLMKEVADLKAGHQGGGGSGSGASQDLSAALSELAGNLNQRLDQMSKKMGISGAVEADDIKFDALFGQEESADIESNLGAIDVKEKSGGGISSAVERLKKLKGDG